LTARGRVAGFRGQRTVLATHLPIEILDAPLILAKLLRVRARPSGLGQRLGRVLIPLRELLRMHPVFTAPSASDMPCVLQADRSWKVAPG